MGNWKTNSMAILVFFPRLKVLIYTVEANTKIHRHTVLFSGCGACFWLCSGEVHGAQCVLVDLHSFGQGLLVSAITLT